MTTVEITRLRQLARRHGIQTHYVDMGGARRDISPEALFAVLGSLGVRVESPGSVNDALRQARREEWLRVLQPVVIAWRGSRATLDVQLPAATAVRRLKCRLELEDGNSTTWTERVEKLDVTGSAAVDGTRFVSKRLRFPARLPVGYHTLFVEMSDQQLETRIVSAPREAFSLRRRTGNWGLFAPLYALHSDRSQGVGDLSDLGDFIEWTATLGGSLVGTLPLLAAFLDRPCEPSPYSPASRLFWNEFYLDLTRVPELATSPRARALFDSPGFRRRLSALDRGALVDYRRTMALKRDVLEVLCRSILSRKSRRFDEFRKYVRMHPQLEHYAAFRAACERHEKPWREWPRRQREGTLLPRDYSKGAKDYHLYVQWLAEEQMARVARRATENGVRLYLDLPLGVHQDGYDVWRERELFALGTAGGAPPDPVYTKGQDWGFAPLHPARLREQHHRYFIEVLRQHLRHARVLRIDHVMGLHRLYWIPRGLPASQGAYVTYPADELYAILNLESHRHRSTIIGENLGTVAPAVNSAMKRHKIRPMYVVQYELRPRKDRPLGPVPAGALASVNTHDMPPWKAFWDGLDIDDRLDQGLLGRNRTSARKRAARERKTRLALRRVLLAFLRGGRGTNRGGADASSALRACLEHLGRSEAGPVLVNLEDLWLETESQNTPGTSTERVNWRRRIRYSLEALRHLPEVEQVLSPLVQTRGGTRSKGRR